MSRPPENSPPEVLIIGHITRDKLRNGYRLGGTAAYSAVVAKRMGARVALFTSGSEGLALDILDGIQILVQPGTRTTTFKNEYTSNSRVQTLTDRASDLELELLPSEWKQAKIVHLAPVASEIPLTAGQAFPDSGLAYTLQGWLRRWDRTGRVSAGSLPPGAIPEGQSTAAFLSLEDLGFNRNGLAAITSRFPLVILTLASEGAELHQAGTVQHIAPISVREKDPTGAGDIFAAVFMIAWLLWRKSPLNSARLANALAAASVAGEGIEGIPSEREIQALSKVYE